MKISQDNDTIIINIAHSRIDGENLILNALLKDGWFKPDICNVVLDFNNVAYINSMGITEIINIHRRFTESASDHVHFKFINLGKKVLEILSMVEIQKIADVTPKSE